MTSSGSLSTKELFPSLWPPPAYGFLKGCMSWHRETVEDSNYINRTAVEIILLVTCQWYFVLGINDSTSKSLWMQWLESTVCYICSAVRGAFRFRCKLNHPLNVFRAILQCDLEYKWLAHPTNSSYWTMCLSQHRCAVSDHPPAHTSLERMTKVGRIISTYRMMF